MPENLSDEQIQNMIEDIDNRLRDHPDDHNARLAKAVYLTQQGMPEEAIVHINRVEKATRHEKDAFLSEMIYLVKGSTASKMERHKYAFLCFEKALKLNPGSGFTYFFAGNALFELGKLREAIPYFDRAIRCRYDDPDVYFRKAQAQNGCGRYRDALKCLKKGARAYPDDANIHCEMGVTYMNMGKFKHSIICQKRAIRVDPQYDLAYIQLSFSYAEMGQHRLARQCLNKMQKLFSKDQDMLEIIDKIRDDYGYRRS